jgi:hypothetical protein
MIWADSGPKPEEFFFICYFDLKYGWVLVLFLIATR